MLINCCQSGRSKCGRSSLIVSNRSGSRQPWEDSDSDTEDFLNIVVESRKAFTFTESTLQKFLKDHVDGVIRDPVEFVSFLQKTLKHLIIWFILTDFNFYSVNGSIKTKEC